MIASARCLASSSLYRFVMKDQQLSGVEGQAGKSTAIVVGELDLKHVWSKQLHDGSDLPTPKLALRQIFGQRHDIQKFYFGVHLCSNLYSTKQLVILGKSSPRRMIHALRTVA
jgi:hypothetical protein